MHIVYETDYHIVLYNLTERYLKSFAQNAMKISLALQVMSSIVAAAIDTCVTTGNEKSF